MKLLSLVSLAALMGSALASSRPSTSSAPLWTITAANATKPDQVLGEHQDYVKVWTVKGSFPVRSIQLAAAGSVFLDYDGTLNTATPEPTTEAPVPTTEPPTTAPPTTEPPTTEPPTTEPSTTQPPATGSGADAPLDGAVSLAVGDEGHVVAKVVFSGNCTDLLDEMEVVEQKGTLKIHFKNTDFEGYGFLLIQVVVGEQGALESISSSGSSNVYVSENVVATSGRSATLSISGDGDVFVTAPNTAFALEALDLKVSGSGTIQFHAASVSVQDTLFTKISGDATIAVVAKTIDVAKTIETKISGDGDVYYQAEKVTTVDVDTKISGQGDVTISTNGTCVSQQIAISGDGNVATGSMLCQDTKVKLSGEGNVLVQTSGTLVVPREMDAKVQYWGATPAQITDGRPPRPTRPPRPHRPHGSCGRKRHGWFWGWGEDECGDDDSDIEDKDDNERTGPQKVTAATENTYKTYKVRDIPAREPVFLALRVRKNFWGSEPNERIVISILGWDIDIGGSAVAANAQQLAAHVHKTHGPLGAAALGLVAVGVVAAVGVAVHKAVMTRRRRSEYQPLLPVMN